MAEKAMTPQARFEKEKCTRVSIKLVNTTDADILAHLAKQTNKQGYIKALIRADMDKTPRK